MSNLHPTTDETHPLQQRRLLWTPPVVVPDPNVPAPRSNHNYNYHHPEKTREGGGWRCWRRSNHKNQPLPPTLKERRGTVPIPGRRTIPLVILPVNDKQEENSTITTAILTGTVPTTTTTTLSLTPIRLLDVEHGNAILMTQPSSLPSNTTTTNKTTGLTVVTARVTVAMAQQYPSVLQQQQQQQQAGSEQVGPSLSDQIKNGIVRNLEPVLRRNTKTVGWAERVRLNWVLRKRLVTALMMMRMPPGTGMDHLGRRLQAVLPFVAAHDAYWISQIIQILDTIPPTGRDTTNRIQQKTTTKKKKKEVEFVVNLAIQNRTVLRILLQQTARLDTIPRPKVMVYGHSSVGMPYLGGRPKDLDWNLNRPMMMVDRSLLYAFVANPLLTLVDRGVIPTLQTMAAHWQTVLHHSQESSLGTFSHHRLEQLDPFQTMRYHIPIVCKVLSTLRRTNRRWDTTVLEPFLRQCYQLVGPSSSSAAAEEEENINGCRRLVQILLDQIITNITAGMASVYDPLHAWATCIRTACDRIQDEVVQVYQKITSVEIGIRFGHDLITQIIWTIPNDDELKAAICLHLTGKTPNPKVNVRRIRSALLLTTIQDKRTLTELVKRGHEKTKPAQLLLNRIKTLVQRSIRREALNEGIRQLSMGEYVTDDDDLVPNDWYWLQDGEKRQGVYIYSGKRTGTRDHLFVHVDSGYDKVVPVDHPRLKFRRYIPVAECISRAQRCYMTIEVEHGKTFHYNAFMEFSFLRLALRRLAVVSQIFCEELDYARLHLLREIQRSNQWQVQTVSEFKVGRTYYTYNTETKSYEPFVCQKEYRPTDPYWKSLLARTTILTVPPQNMIVIGTGPTALITVIHCTENVLMTGGVMKLFESREDSSAGETPFDWAQIVRLDARWIGMLRYYLGIGFEDTFIPASGDTDAQLGNTCAREGVVEITMKDLENLLQVEVSRMWSKCLIQCYSNANAKYDPDTNTIMKQGQHLQLDDIILRNIDMDGKPSEELFSWKVAELIHQPPLGLDNLQVGREYGVFIRHEDSVLPFRLTGVDIQSRTYTFKALREGAKDVKATAHNLPSIYPRGASNHAAVNKIIFQSVERGLRGGYAREELRMSAIRFQKFTVHVGASHVVQCTGRPSGSNTHLKVATCEPYGMCCISGLKVSLVMHNFGENRFRSSSSHDFKSNYDQNTRVTGDSPKIVHQHMIAEEMLERMRSQNWQMHFVKLVTDSKFPFLDELDPIIPKLRAAVRWHAINARSFKKRTIQIRFFETGDNFYLCMEFTREYDKWKNDTAEDLISALRNRRTDKDETNDIECIRGALVNHIDRLWYESCLEVIRRGDAYHRKRIPKLYTINSYTPTELRNVEVAESVRVSGKELEKYDVLVKTKKQILVRNAEGCISKMDRKTMVLREGNLSRGPDGNRESKIALATFPVDHHVNFRTLRVNHDSRGYVFAFVGDEQSTPHFISYTCLAGACINATLVNTFVGRSLDGVSFRERCALYCKETNWSNSEVITRGASSNYGRDGFLRPSFPYRDAIDYLHSKVVEGMETGQDLDNVLSREWLNVFAAALVPAGMQLDQTFVGTLYQQTRGIVFDKFVEGVEGDENLNIGGHVDNLLAFRNEADKNFWNQLTSSLDDLDESTGQYLNASHVQIAKKTIHIIEQIVDFATKC